MLHEILLKSKLQCVIAIVLGLFYRILEEELMRYIVKGTICLIQLNKLFEN